MLSKQKLMARVNLAALAIDALVFGQPGSCT